MRVWDDLKTVLARLRDEQPGTLTLYPMPDVDQDRKPPFRIHLAPWAAATAGQLHQQFGGNVDLTVGALPYPPGRQPQHPPWAGEPAELLDPCQLTAELDGPATICSGHTLHHGLLLRNHTAADLQIATNGQVTAAVVDPGTGQVVGGYCGAQPLPLVVFRITPAGTASLPLLIGTASTVPELGYAIPAGTWGIQATLALGPPTRTAPRRRTPILPLTITT